MNSGKGFKADYDAATVLLGVILAAPAIVNLVQHIFQIHLHFGFSQVVQFYRAMFAPIIDAVHWPIRALLSLAHLHVVIPQWFKDLHTLSFVLAGIYVRGWGADTETSDPTERGGARSGPLYVVEGSLQAFILGVTFAAFGAWLYRLIMLASGLSEVARLRARGIMDVRRKMGAAGYLRIGDDDNRDADLDRKLLEQSVPFIRYDHARKYRSLGLTTVATLAAVTVFYVSNAILPLIINH